MNDATQAKHLIKDAANLDQQTLRILRRLCETGAVLAVAEGMDTAVVVRESSDGRANKTASVSAEFVAVLALNDWIDCTKPGRVSRYKLTPAGRTKLAQLSDDHISNTPDPMGDQGTSDAFGTTQDMRRKRVRYNLAESPVAALARRKCKDGTPFLSEELVDIAERLREDFELAQMGPRVAQNWDAFLTAGTDQGRSAHGSNDVSAPSKARERVAKALRALGPGLGDVALRCCCYLEGLESTEKHMGWSARSGKIVLRIALQRLRLFYDTELGDVLIG